MNVLNRIKLKISRGEYSFSDHSIYDKLEICGFTTEDLLNAVSTCKTVIKQTNTRAERDMLYIGYAISGKPIEIVCRFYNKKVYFITVYDYE
ncbi:MAG: DUF4258 domain-containing protein [Pyrinomonadaceae bacterium]